MTWLRVFLVLSLFLGLAEASPRAWAQDEEIELEDADFEEFDAADDDVSFEDFGAEAAPAEAEAEVKTTDEEELSLEPLQGDEDQVTEAPEEQVPPAEGEPVPEELTPAPVIAEPDAEPAPEEASPEPTPEPIAQSIDDTPDLDLEARLYDIYINYHSKKLSSEEWSALIGERESETYSIQRGDTLWSISKTFFNDGNYWPKIWQLNSSITNPHLIQPGNTIRFLLGTESEMPAFAVTESNQEPLEIPAGEGGAAAVTTEVTKTEAESTTGTKETVQVGRVEGAPSDEVEIPPPSENYNPVLHKIPPSLPEWGIERRGKEYDDLGVDYGRRKILDLQDKKYLESFIDDEVIAGDGEVREIEGGANTAASYQYIFVGLPPGAGKTGDIYTVVGRAVKLERVNKEVATVDLGYQYRIQGEVVLQDFLSSVGGKKPQDIFRAYVKRTLSQIDKSAIVVKGSMPSISVEAKGERNDVVTQIVGAHLIDPQHTLALHTLAYISGGKSMGLAPGHLLTVRANTRVRNSESIISESYIPVGQLKVLKVGERLSTAIVVKVWDAMFVGDVTGAGKVLPPVPPERRRSGATGAARASAAPPAAAAEDEVNTEPEPATKGGEDQEFDDFEDLEEDL